MCLCLFAQSLPSLPVLVEEVQKRDKEDRTRRSAQRVSSCARLAIVLTDVAAAGQNALGYWEEQKDG